MLENRPVSPERIETIKHELMQRMEREQSIRGEMAKLFENGTTVAELHAGPLPMAMKRIDEENQEFLRKTIAECGWIDALRFGAKAARAAFLIVQHSDGVQLMSDALPFIEADARAKRINGDQYALLFDRLNLRLNGKQRYGSQIVIQKDGEWVLEPLEDVARVEELRKELGMEPLEQYLNRFKTQNGNKPIKLPQV